MRRRAEPANQLVSTEAHYSNFTVRVCWGGGEQKGDSVSTQCVIVPFFVRGMRALSSPRTALIRQDCAHILGPTSPWLAILAFLGFLYTLALAPFREVPS